MFLLLFLFWIFQLSFAFQIPVCKTVRHTGIFNDAYLSSLYTFSFDLTVNANTQNLSYPNTVTVTNFTEWFSNSTVFNRISPWSFVLYDKINKSIECPSMTENCVIQFPNGQQRYYFDFSYKNGTDSTKFVLGTKVFVNEGTFFDGVSGDFWNPRNLTNIYMAINMSFSGTDLSLNGYSICTNFDYINIPDSGNDMCNTFEMNTTISIPFVSNPIYTNAKVVVTNMTYKVENFSVQNLPDQTSMYVDYILDPSIPINTQELRFPDNVHYDFLFDYNSSQHQLNGIFLGELIKRNGMFLKNENQPFTPADPCWIKYSNVPFTNATYITNFCCTNFSQSSPSPPESDGIGTLCSNETTQAWLDVVFVIDTSNSMSPQNLKTLAGEIASLMKRFTIGSNGDHTTRVGILLFVTNVTVYLQLNETTNYQDLYNKLKVLSNYASPNNGGSLNDALIKADSMLPFPVHNKIAHRIPIIVLFVAAYDQAGYHNADITAQRIKNDGRTIVVVNYGLGDLANILNIISSPGYYYTSNQHELFILIRHAFTQINCACPLDWTQLVINNTGTVEKYADCYWTDGSQGDPQIINDLSCSPGTLVSIKSQQNLNFITDQFIPHNPYIKGTKQFTVSLHKSDSDGNWKWWGFNDVEYPYENFPPMATPAPTDDYGYMWNWYGLNWTLQTGSDFQYQFICQQRACDAEYSCEARDTQ